jgi:hypothetical protein
MRYKLLYVHSFVLSFVSQIFPEQNGMQGSGKRWNPCIVHRDVPVSLPEMLPGLAAKR